MQVAVARDLDLEQRAAALVARAGTAPERALVCHGDGVLRLGLLERLGEQPLVVLGGGPHARVELAVFGARARHPHDPLVVGVHLRRQLLQTRRAQCPRFMQSTQNLVLSGLKQRPVPRAARDGNLPYRRSVSERRSGECSWREKISTRTSVRKKSLERQLCRQSAAQRRPVVAADKPPQLPIPRRCTGEDRGCRSAAWKHGCS